MQSMSNNLYPAYNKFLAGYLKTKGYEIVGVAPNERNVAKLVYFFERTPELLADVDAYWKEYNGKRASQSNTAV